ncbi:MAG: diacylglycerol kinase [Steroidobacteraceae bacterium]
MNEHKNQAFIRRLRFALAGILIAWRSERSFRFQLFALVVVVAGCAFVRLEPAWWAIVLLTSAMVVSAELFNTALEHLADHLHPDVHPRIRIVKDCAAAAVLMASCAAIAVGIAVIVHLMSR